MSAAPATTYGAVSVTPAAAAGMFAKLLTPNPGNGSGPPTTTGTFPESRHEGDHLAVGRELRTAIRSITLRDLLDLTRRQIGEVDLRLAERMATRLLTSLLFGVGVLDPVTFSGVGALMLTAALAASYVPARRATKTDPVAALRIG